MPKTVLVKRRQAGNTKALVRRMPTPTPTPKRAAIFSRKARWGVQLTNALINQVRSDGALRPR